MAKLTDKVYIVTGGGGAIAGSIANVFRSSGARLALAGLAGDPLRRRAADLDALALEVDLTSFDDAVRMVSETEAHYGRLDGLIHTAGGFAMTPAHTTEPDSFDHLMAINVRTLFCATRAVLPRLLEVGDGLIAAFSAGPVWRQGGGGMTAYAAAKGAVAAYLRALNEELASSTVKVAIVYPMGPVDTPANRSAMPDADPQTWIDPREIAEALAFAAERSGRGRLLELPLFPSA